MKAGLDCRWCGACCCNPSERQREGDTDYVAIERGDAIVEHPAMMERHSVIGSDGAPYLRLTPEGCCVALDGRVGRRNRCTIYDYRPSGCREVVPGSIECLARRRDAGL